MKFTIILTCLVMLQLQSIDAGQFYHVNGTSYYISYPTMTKNWYQAQRYCTLHGMYLAAIHSEQQYDIILELLEKQQINAPHIHFWTSGTDLGQANREYYWAASGFPFTFTHWLGGCPRVDQTSKLCVLLNGDTTIKYRFYDHDCNTMQYVLCQSNLELPEMQRNQHCIQL